MTENQFLAEAITNVRNVKRFLLGADFGIETNVQQNVAQFFANFVVVLLDESVAEFIDFFNGVGTQALVGLLPVPGTLDA